jgi:hypothetical protein
MCIGVSWNNVVMACGTTHTDRRMIPFLRTSRVWDTGRAVPSSSVLDQSTSRGSTPRPARATCSQSAIVSCIFEFGQKEDPS